MMLRNGVLCRWEESCAPKCLYVYYSFYPLVFVHNEQKIIDKFCKHGRRFLWQGCSAKKHIMWLNGPGCADLNIKGAEG